MKKNHQKTILFVLLLSVSLVSSVLVQARELENDYPSIPGISSPQDNLPEFIKYIFSFLIVASGIIGLFILILAGVRYISSAGQPEKLSNAKKQLLSAFWGVVLLLSSWILLYNINPQLVSLQLPNIVDIPAAEIPPPPTYTIPTSDLLNRIKVLAEKTKEVPEAIQKTGQEIKQLTDKCDCKNTKPICLCDGGDEDSKCEAKTCYAGISFHPCHDKKDIQNLQKKIIDQKDMVLYYKDRVVSEKEDLEVDISQFLTKKISWYEKQIQAEQQMPGEPNQRAVEFLEERKSWLEEEKQYKQELVQQLEQLAKALEKIPEPAVKIPELSAKCFTNVKDKCEPSCKQGSDYGCHDKVKGCQPDKCSGGNPCPTNEIQTELNKINPQEIKSISEQIISIVDNIKKERIQRTIF